MARRPRNWQDRTAHVGPFEWFEPVEPDDPRYVAHVEGRQGILEDGGEPFESVQAAVAWARERAPVVWVRLRGEVDRRPAGEAQGAAHEDPSKWVPARPAGTGPDDGLTMSVEVRQGFRRRSERVTSALVARLDALNQVEQVKRGRDVGDMRLLDRLPASGGAGLAVPEGGRLTCAALVRVPREQGDSAFAYARRLVDDELQRVLRDCDALGDDGDPLGQLGPEWSVQARRAGRRLFSPLDEFDETG